MTVADISIETNDFDTLGGRLNRARDAKNATVAEVAELVGVQINTLEEWECDRAEPRSNRLTMLAGVLGVSPSWLLFGRGASPQDVSAADKVDAIEVELDRLKFQHQKLGTAIVGIEEALTQASMEKTD